MPLRSLSVPPWDSENKGLKANTSFSEKKKKKKKKAPLSAQSNAIRMTDHTETPHVSTSSRLLYVLNLNKRYLCYSLQYVSILTPSLQLYSARAYQCDAVLSKMCAV